MSYEKKIKDLMARLAAMSPEPPPFPEETPMVRPETRRSSRPALAFVVAAALVAVLAVPLLLFTGEEEPVAVDTTTTTTTIATTSTSTPEGTSTTIATTTTSPTPVDVSGVVFLYQTPENSFTGGDPAMVPIAVTVHVFGEQDVDFATAWQWVGEGRMGLPNGLEDAVPVDVVVEGTTVAGDVIIAEMSDAFVDGASPTGLLADMTMLNQLIYTLTLTDPEAGVLFTVDGEPVQAFGSEGLDLTASVDRETFRDDHLHTINLTSPIVQLDDGTYLVEGIANVFEATVNIAVIDGDGEIVHEEFVTASCGSGCWGDFSVNVDGSLIVPDESSIMVFTRSAEDGSIVDAITVPIPESGAWEYTVGG